MDFYQILALIAGALIVGNTLSQLFKIIKTKKVDDLSLVMFLMIFLAQVIWLVYGLHIQDMPVILTNGFGMLFTIIIIGLIFRYRTVPVNN
ncbi:MAG: SemiSWEET family transporter [Patescibacteria group bacterium]